MKVVGGEVQGDTPESGRKQIAQQSSTPSELLHMVVAQGANMDKIEKFMELAERWEANQARKAYVAAMARFKKNPPEIFKTKHVKYKNKDGSFTEYDHATIGDVTTVIVAALASEGFSHRWDTKQPDGGMIEVYCIITHELGHSESTMLKASRDESGGKNNIQGLGSAVTYMQRYTLLSATGLAVNDQPDDDGAGSEGQSGAEQGGKVEEKQQAAPPDYPQATFDANMPAWKTLIESGKKTAETIIKLVESKGSRMTEFQRAALKTIKKSAAQPESAK